MSYHRKDYTRKKYWVDAQWEDLKNPFILIRLIIMATWYPATALFQNETVNTIWVFLVLVVIPITGVIEYKINKAQEEEEMAKRLREMEEREAAAKEAYRKKLKGARSIYHEFNK